MDAIAPALREGGEELSQRMVGALLSLMDGMSRTDGILVIAATNRPECIEPALRRPGRFDREIEIGDLHSFMNLGTFGSLMFTNRIRMLTWLIKTVGDGKEGWEGEGWDVPSARSAMAVVRTIISLSFLIFVCYVGRVGEDCYMGFRFSAPIKFKLVLLITGQACLLSPSYLSAYSFISFHSFEGTICESYNFKDL